MTPTPEFIAALADAFGARERPSIGLTKSIHAAMPALIAATRPQLDPEREKLVERLRRSLINARTFTLLEEAADHIEAQAAEIARLNALVEGVEMLGGHMLYSKRKAYEDRIAELEAALAERDAEIAALREALELAVKHCPQCEGKGVYTFRRRVVPCEFCEDTRAALERSKP